MTVHKEYTIVEEEPLMVSEPALAFGEEEPTVEDFLAALPKDLMLQVVLQANEECRAGKGTPHSQMTEWINTRMGW